MFLLTFLIHVTQRFISVFFGQHQQVVFLLTIDGIRVGIWTSISMLKNMFCVRGMMWND